MADKKINLNNIKAEIESRKQGRNTVSSSLGEPVGTGVAPRDVFLHGLVESLKTGRETASSSLVKTVENTVASKKGEKAKLPITQHAPAPTAQPMIQQPRVEMSPERDDQLFADMERARKQTLAESINTMTGGQTAPTSPTVNYGNTQYLTAPPQGAQVQGAPLQLNEGALQESVRQIVNNHLVENFGPVLEEAIKSTVIEMYAEERIERVLKENTQLIEKVVYATIRKLQNKKKS